MAKTKDGGKRRTYRFGIIDDVSGKEVRSGRFTRTGVVLLIISVLVTVLALGYCLVAFTPLRTTVPGYPDASARRAVQETAMRLDSLEGAMIRWRLYSENLRRVLTGKQTVEPDSLTARTREYLSRKSPEQLALQDSILRENLARQENYARARKESSIPLENIHFTRPVKAVVGISFDPTLHPATDLVASAGEPVRAVLAGTVIFAGKCEEDGCSILIQHYNNILTSYSHAGELLVREGDRVKAGQTVAVIGDSSDENIESHLHFEMWFKGGKVDPEKYIKF